MSDPHVIVTIAIPPQNAIIKEKLSVSFNPIQMKIKPPVAKAKMSLHADAEVFTKTFPGKY